MKRTLKAEVQTLAQYFGLPADPRLERLLDQLDSALDSSHADLHDDAGSLDRRAGEDASVDQPAGRRAS